ncbi:MAG: ABC transporter ATP-binding protein [Burkholderiales bacterium]|nr:ABC transporter ATP-binding protein [Anaerolineae bacterium]
MATIELVDIAHAYVPGTYAVQNINLRWEHGANSALLGPSGCGKTTLLKIISGLERPTKGRILLDGKEINHLTPKERNIAQVFQFPVVYETLSVYDNLAFPLRNRRVPEADVRKRVNEIADLLELSDKLKQGAAALSAAEKQLISLGRGVVRDDLGAVLLDEPLTVIDPQQKWHLRRKLKQMQQRFEITMIYVTHDQHEALTFADQVTVMNVGLALQTGSPKELHDRPQAPFVGYFIGSPGMNIFDAVLEGNQVRAGAFVMPVPDSVGRELAGRRLKIGIRPEFVEVLSAPTANALACKVDAVHLTGPYKILDLSGGDLHFKARVPDTSTLQTGADIWTRFPNQWTMLYADDQSVALPTLTEENAVS